MMPDDKSSPMGLFKKYLANKRIFQNREVLRHNYRPQILPHRKPQIDELASILAPALTNETPSNILIYGKTGTGKTASVHYVGAELENASSLSGTKCRVVHLNCEVIDTQYRVLAQIANSLDDLDAHPSDSPRNLIPMTGWPTDQVYAELKKQLESGGGVVVIVLDEIDNSSRRAGMTPSITSPGSTLTSDLQRSASSGSQTTSVSPIFSTHVSYPPSLRRRSSFPHITPLNSATSSSRGRI